ETPSDYAAIRRVNQLAFGTDNEANLVDALREQVNPYLSLVTIEDGQIVGHIFFSPVEIESDSSSFTAIGLAPMAVLPEYQNRGIGSALVEYGLRECRRLGHDIVVVVGHSEYYPRFGFTPARAKGLRCEYDVPNEVFMVAELSPGALGGRQGLVRYHPEFKKHE
ncbi:MAG TPA: N-acetyltransferase, partial [Pyrinomonadaceae bacterium]|nr:N-acetyltransferase [Pyrinomonadaceae bacterium]